MTLVQMVSGRFRDMPVRGVFEIDSRTVAPFRESVSIICERWAHPSDYAERTVMEARSRNTPEVMASWYSRITYNLAHYGGVLPGCLTLNEADDPELLRYSEQEISLIWPGNG